MLLLGELRIGFIEPLHAAFVQPVERVPESRVLVFLAVPCQTSLLGWPLRGLSSRRERIVGSREGEHLRNILFESAQLLPHCLASSVR